MAIVTELPVPYKFSGEAYLLRNGSRILLNGSGENPKLRNGDGLITGKGVVWEIEDGGSFTGKGVEDTRITMFPDSELILSIGEFKRDNEPVTVQMITKVQLVKGLFRVLMSSADDLSKKLIIAPNFPKIEFKPLNGEFGRKKEIETCIELNENKITLFWMDAKIISPSLGVEAKIGDAKISHGKITITPTGVYATNLVEYPDKRITLAKKIYDYVSTGQIKQGPNSEEAGQIILPPYSQIREEDRVVPQKKVTRTTTGFTELADEYWNKQRSAKDRWLEEAAIMRKEFDKEYEYAPKRLRDKMLKELQKKINAKYKEYSAEEKKLGEELGSKQLKSIDAGKKGLTAMTKAAPISKALQYRNVDFQFTVAEKGTEKGPLVCPKGKEFLLIRFKVNNKTKQLFFSPDSEFSLLAENQLIPLDNYLLETNMDTGYSGEGFFQFRVPEEATSFVLQLGKKTDAKTTLAFKI